jgi:hypothetical protein
MITWTSYTALVLAGVLYWVLYSAIADNTSAIADNTSAVYVKQADTIYAFDQKIHDIEKKIDKTIEELVDYLQQSAAVDMCVQKLRMDMATRVCRVCLGDSTSDATVAKLVKYIRMHGGLVSDFRDRGYSADCKDQRSMVIWTKRLVHKS